MTPEEEALRPATAEEFFSVPEYATASTEERLAALDQWAADATEYVRLNDPEFKATDRAQQTAKIREMRQAILDGKRFSESASETARDVGVSLAASGLAATAASAAGVNAAMGHQGDLQDVGGLLGTGVVRILDRLSEQRETGDPAEIERLAAEGFTKKTRLAGGGFGAGAIEVPYVDRREKLDKALATLKEGIDNGTFPDEPEAFVGWLKDRNMEILRESARYNGEARPEQYSDQETRRFDSDLELQGLLSTYARTRNDAAFEAITKRLTASSAREQADADTQQIIEESKGVIGEIRDQGETLDGPLAGPLRALLKAPGVSQATIEATGDPVELASTVVSAVLTGGTAKAVSAAAGAGRAGRVATVAANTAADVAIEAGTEAFQAYVEDSRGDILGAAKQGGLVGLAFQLTGAAFGGAKRIGAAATRKAVTTAMGPSPAKFVVDDRIFVPEGDSWREILPKGREAEGSVLYDAARDPDGLQVMTRLEAARARRAITPVAAASTPAPEPPPPAAVDNAPSALETNMDASQPSNLESALAFLGGMDAGARGEIAPSGRSQREDSSGDGARRSGERSLEDYAQGSRAIVSGQWLESLEELQGGNEHETFRDPSQPGWRIKVTNPNLALATGRSRIPAITEEGYLERWRLGNEVFGDGAELIGVIPGDSGTRIVMRQPEVEAADPENPHPNPGEINEWMRAAGFEYESGAWVRDADGVVVTDAHEGNFIKTERGIRPIDVDISRTPEAKAAGTPIIPWADNPANPDRLSPVQAVADPTLSDLRSDPVASEAGAPIIDRTIATGPDQRLGFAAMPDPRALEAEAGRIAAGAPPAPGDSLFSKILYGVKSRIIENGTLPRGMRELIRQAGYRSAGYEAIFTSLGNQIAREIETHVTRRYGRGAVAERQAMGGIAYQALRGDVAALAALPPEVRGMVESGRESIDQFSEQLIADGVVDGDLAAKIGDNMGTYILREFRVFDPKANWNYETIRQQHANVYTAAINEIMAVSNVTQDEADAAVREMTDPTRAQSFYLGSGTAGKVDVTSFIKRKDLSQPILDLLGEVRDPAANLTNTGSKIAGIWVDHSAQSAMREALIQSGLASPDRSTADGRNWHRIGEESYEVPVIKNDDASGAPEIQKFRRVRTKKNLAGFGELYTTPEMGAAIEAYFAAENPKDHLFRSLAKVAATVTGTGKFAQVILNPAAYPTNMSGAIWTEIFNGRISPSGALKFGQSMADAAKTSPQKYTIQEQQSLYAQSGQDFMNAGGASKLRFEAFKHEMSLRGIRDNSVFAEDLNQTVRAGFGERWQKVTAAGGKLYQIPDNAAKANAFAFELDKWARAEPSLPINELMDLAAADVRATTQNYDQVPQGLKRLSQYGLLVPTYLSFSWELARNTVNTAKIAAREMRSGNPVLVRYGAQRIAGMVAVGAALATLNGMRGGNDEEKEKAINRSFLPPWLEGQGVMIMESGEGTVRYADPAYLIPHQLFWNALEAGLNADSPPDAIEDAAGALSGGFSDLNIASQTFSEIVANKKEGGNAVWNDEIAAIDPQHKSQAIAWHILRSMYMPGIARTIEKIRKAQAGEIGYMGNKATVDDIAAQAIGLRPYTVDFRVATQDKLRAFATRYRTAASFSSEARQKRQDPERAAADQAKEDAAIERLRGEVETLVEDAKTLGVAPGEIRDMVTDAKLPAKIRPKL